MYSEVLPITHMHYFNTLGFMQMKYYFKLFSILIFICVQVRGQVNLDSIKFITEMPYCLDHPNTQTSNILFWKIVEQKEKIISDLIELIDDSTQTIAQVRLFGGEWTVGDIAYNAIQEIIPDIPTFELLGVKFDSQGCGYCTYWYFLRQDYQNRIKFKKSVKKWYNENKMNLTWKKGDRYSDCFYKNPNGGYFIIK